MVPITSLSFCLLYFETVIMYPRLASLLRSQEWHHTPAPPALTSRVLVLQTTHMLHGAGAQTQGLELVRQSSTIYIPNLFLSLFFFPPYCSLSGLIPFLVPLRNNINCFFFKLSTCFMSSKFSAIAVLTPLAIFEHLFYVLIGALGLPVCLMPGSWVFWGSTPISTSMS